MEKDDVVLIKDIIPNCSLSKKIAEMLGTKVKVEDINRTEIKVKGVWIPKEFVKEVIFKHSEKTTPLLLRIARSFSKYVITFLDILFALFILFFIIACNGVYNLLCLCRRFFLGNR